MFFTSIEFAVFCTAVFSIYYLLKPKALQNGFLLLASYFFYGYIHPWFCGLLLGVTVVNWGAALLISKSPNKKKSILAAAAVLTLGQLAWFKYFNFFASSVGEAAAALGFKLGVIEMNVFLPLGISFYTFQALSYTVDVYRGNIVARRNFIDFALFAAFFPQLASGPITRAEKLLTAVETERRFDWTVFSSAWPLLVSGFFKKLVIADNISVYVDKVFSLKEPSFYLLAAASAAFTLQIYADFSACTDIARGTARLFGLELAENFRQPYAAVSPSDFWRRWHISFSTWIRDYIYIPLGGSRAHGAVKPAIIVLITFGISGLWHGAAWHFVLWGLYHGILLVVYRQLGFAGKWQPTTLVTRIIARTVILVLITFGWTLFRMPSVSWLVHAISSASFFHFNFQTFAVFCIIAAWTTLYALPLVLIHRLEKADYRIRAFVFGLMLVAVTVFIRDGQQDFIYFQF